MKRSDEYWAQRAKKEGYRSRASYKLLQLDEKYNLITKSSLIFDLGCAPGGWSQVIAEKINVSAKCIAIDLLNMQRVDKVEFHQIDLFSNQEDETDYFFLDVYESFIPYINVVSFVESDTPIISYNYHSTRKRGPPAKV